MTALKLDGQTTVFGKCQYWRERMNEDDRWDIDLRAHERRVMCSCFVEGAQWDATVGTLPDDCPEHFQCRYHIRTW